MSDGTRNSIQGFALASSFFAGKLNVFFGGDFGADYRVVDTDYTSYAIIYSCTNVATFGFDLSWFLVRNQIEKSSIEYT